MIAPTVPSSLPGRQPMTTASIVRTRLIFTIPLRSPGRYGRGELLGDHALLVVQPVLRALGGALDRRQLEPGDALEHRAALLVGALHQHLVLDGQHVEGDEARRRLLGQPRDPRRRRMDALAERAERRRDELAVDDVAPGGEAHLGEVARQVGLPLRDWM